MAIKYLADVMTDEENLSRAYQKSETAFSEICLDNSWEKIEKKLPDNPVLQDALKHAIEEKIGIVSTKQEFITQPDVHTDKFRDIDINDKLKYIQKDIITLLQTAIRNSSDCAKKGLETETETEAVETHAQIVHNAQEILVNSIYNSRQSKDQSNLIGQVRMTGLSFLQYRMLLKICVNA